MLFVLIVLACFNLCIFADDVITSANSNGIQELNVGSETIVWCNRTKPNENLKTWSLNGTEVVQDKHHVISGNQLKITHSVRTRDEGPLTCTFSDGVNKTIILAAKVWIDKFQPLNKIKDVKSVNIVEGEDLVLHCHANSTLRAKFRWFMIQNSTSNPRKEEETIKELFNFTIIGFDNLTSEYKVQGIKSEDRAYYSCVASNDFGNDTVKMLVRVKDKYAALWPFVGIVGEVIILCTIIFIYEKRRQKPDFDDSADNPDESKSSVAQGTSKGQDIRQRK